MIYYTDELSQIHAFDESSEEQMAILMLVKKPSWRKSTQADFERPLEALIQLKKDKLKLDCKTEIESGITYQILGEDFTYPTTKDDQHNLTAVYVKSQMPNSLGPYLFWCGNQDGVWDRREHTAIQIKEIALLVFDKVTAAQDKYANLLNQLKMAENKEAVEAVNW